MEKFEVNRKDFGDLSALQISGFLDAHTAPNLEDAIQKLVDEGRYKIVVNFETLSYISSAGLGVFMGFIEEIRKAGGDIKMCGMSPKIYRIFDLLGFPTLYQIVEKENEAIQSFTGELN